MSKTMQAIIFYALTMGLALLARLAVPLIGGVVLPVTMLTPAIAVAIMLTFVAPEGGITQAMKNLGLASAGLKGWIFAICAPVAINLCGFAILVATGMTALSSPFGGFSAGQVLLDLIISLVMGTLLALGEEVGWRGYMLPRLRDIGLVHAMLIVGLLHGIWHLPVLLTTDYYHQSGNPWIVAPMFLITLMLAGVFYGFLRTWTGSVWPVAIAHAAANSAWDFSQQASATKTPAVLEYVGGESGLLMIFGLLVVSAVLIRRLPSVTELRRLAH